MRWFLSSRAPLIAALLIALYAGLLRLDALVAKYGPLDHPRWAAVVTQYVAPLGTRLRPFELGWPREQRPYHGGDPINYLRYAREMESFYQGHVREPVFLALTRGFLWLLSNQDVAVSFASALGSVLAVLGTYFVAAALVPSPAALAASLLVAVDYDVITWAPDGWRDDTFMAAVLWTTWAILRVRDSPGHRSGVLLGVCAAAACLTRITALSFIAPALVWLSMDAPHEARRTRLHAVLVSGGIALLLIAPYLINCWRTAGDPLIAVNYHTVYYRHGEGLPTNGKVSAAEYIAGKFGRRPVATFDTGFNGIFIQPFTTKWRGLSPMLGAGSTWVAGAAVAGMMLLPFSAAGRLLLVVLFTSLLPYAFTWNIGGGDAWRFTMHAYPLYLVAASYAVARAWSAAATLWRTRRFIPLKPIFDRRTAALATAVVICAAAIAAIYRLLPWVTVREAIAQGEDVSIEAGARDTTFYREGWSPAHDDGVTVRVSTTDRAVVHIPLTSGSTYDVVVRMDPVAPDAEQRVSILLNGRFAARFTLTWDPQRVGSYRMHLQAQDVRDGRNEMVLIPERLIPAASAGPRFAWLPPDKRIGIRLWYVRVLPIKVPNQLSLTRNP